MLRDSPFGGLSSALLYDASRPSIIGLFCSLGLLIARPYVVGNRRVSNGDQVTPGPRLDVQLV